MPNRSPAPARDRSARPATVRAGRAQRIIERLEVRTAPGLQSLPRWFNSLPVVLATLLQLAGIMCLAGYLIEPRWPGFWDVACDVFYATNLDVSASAFGAVIYTTLALAAGRRKRVAVWVIIWALEARAVLSFSVHALARAGAFDMASREVRGIRTFIDPRLDVTSLTVAVAVIALLLVARPVFAARIEHRAWLRAIATLGVGVGASAITAFACTFIDHGRLHTIRARVRWSLDVAVPGLFAEPPPIVGPEWIATLAGTISTIAVLIALAVFVRSARTQRAMSDADELEVRRLLLMARQGDSLGYFATRREKSVVFSRDRRAAIAFRVQGGVCVASGDPIGPPEVWPQAIAAWIGHARSYGWTPAVVSVSAPAARRYADAGLRLIQMGDEAVVTVRTFNLASPAYHRLATEVARVARAGYTLRVRRQAEIDDHELAGLGRLAARWRGDESERGFSMALGRFGDRSDDAMIIVTAHDPEGQVRALLSFVPWGRRGLSLDLMRRSPDAVSGVVPFMISGLVEIGADAGADRISLNFAMFRHLFDQGEQLGAGPIDRTLLRVLRLASRKWQLESLYHANSRYHPQWVSRYVGYERGANLTYVAGRIAQLEGFLPTLRVRRRSHAPDGGPRRDPFAFARAVRDQEAMLSVARPPEHPRSEQELARIACLDVLRDAGMDPYPVTLPPVTPLREVLAAGTVPDFDTSLSAGPSTDPHADDGSATAIGFVARVLTVRDHGGVVFATVVDQGEYTQLVAERDRTDQFELLRRAVTPGDQIYVSGHLAVGPNAQARFAVRSWTMAAKCLAAMPDKRRGVTDPYARARLRHAYLATSPEARGRLLARSQAVKALRDHLHGAGFIEVETPILQTVHGGANARPFRTHINAYGMDLSLRIAPELALKKLAVGGIERVFEIGRNFRNEGVDATHNPEFTALEAYQAYADFNTMRLLTVELIRAAAVAVHGRPVALRDGSEVDLAGDWPVIDVYDAVSEAVEASVTTASSAAQLRAIAARWGVAIGGLTRPGEIVARLYDDLVEPATTVPTFYRRFPVETSPLTRVDRLDPALAERWDLVAFGSELGTAYSELIDPLDQRARLTAQSLRAAAGDPEAMELDESFLEALEFGMPPTGGLGLGVDRIVMFLLGVPIRDTLAFPFVRPQRR